MATALITGGTSGIGAEFARALAKRGDDLVLVARDAERLSETAIALKQQYGVSVETLSADLGVRDDVERVAQRLASADQPIDTLISNAGFGVRARLAVEDFHVHENAIDVMIRAVLILGGTAGRVMRERGHGTIINVSSTAGYVRMGSYSAIKAWVAAYTEGLANELHGSGVAVTALCPGWVRTEFHQRADINSSSIPELLWLNADTVVEQALADAANGKIISIPSRRYQTLMFMIQHAPRAAVRAVSRKMSSSRH